MRNQSDRTPGRVRDVRLDFFRGFGMFIIFISHIRQNPWAEWIPGRFGFSDATEIFVFCSGMASAIAFAKIFDERGMALGTARISYRVWQVYWAHICTFFAILAVVVAIDNILDTGTKYTGRLNMLPFLYHNTDENLIGLLTLTYVPNYFDILPMYLVILALVPVVMLLSKLGRWPVFAIVIGLWLAATNRLIEFPAEPWSSRIWFFNPLAWQLVFFTGFAFVRGWLPAPPVDWRLVILALVIVIGSYPIKDYPTFQLLGIPDDIAAYISFNMNKTHFGLLRYIHFLALAYLAWAAAGEGGHRLSTGPFINVCRKVGQQALAVFMVGLMASYLGGVAYDLVGRTLITVPLINLTGCAVLIATAYTVAWYKSGPWRGPADQPSDATARVGGRVPQGDPV